MMRLYAASVVVVNTVWLFARFGWLAAVLGVLLAAAYRRATEVPRD